MLAKELISKNRFRTFLEKTFINKNDITLLMYLFYFIKNIETHEKIMFLLYNEYLTIDEVLDCVKLGMEEAEGEESSEETDDRSPEAIIQERIADLINYTLDTYGIQLVDHTYILANKKPYDRSELYYTEEDGVYTPCENFTQSAFEAGISQENPTSYFIRVDTDVSYKYAKTYFLRDYLTTLKWKDYANIANIADQIEIVYDSLDSTETGFLLDVLGITRSSLINLVRYQTEANKIELAKIERYNSFELPTSSAEPELLDGTTFRGYLLSEDDVPTTGYHAGDYYIAQKDVHLKYNNQSLLHVYKYQILYATQDDDGSPEAAQPGNQQYWSKYVTLASVSDILNRTPSSNDLADTSYYYNPVLIQESLVNSDFDDKETDLHLVVDLEKSFPLRTLLLSVLNKISLGTIH